MRHRTQVVFYSRSPWAFFGLGNHYERWAGRPVGFIIEHDESRVSAHQTMDHSDSLLGEFASRKEARAEVRTFARCWMTRQGPRDLQLEYVRRGERAAG
jgi:hypothetical protein